MVDTALSDISLKQSNSLNNWLINFSSNKKISPVVNVNVKDLFDFEVIQQPDDNCAYVDEGENVITQFHLAKKQGVIGLLAHNYKAGKYFYQLDVNQVVHIVFDDKSSRSFQVDHFHIYRALDPENPYTRFIDLDNPGRGISARQVFEDIYSESNTLVFQTCIEVDDIQSWGRYFAIAKPLD